MSCNYHIKNVQLIDHFGSEPSNNWGTIYVTYTHTVFKTDDRGKEIWIVNTLIETVERTPPSVAGSRLIIKTKHFLVLVFQITKDNDCQNLLETLLRVSKLTSITESFAFFKNVNNDQSKFWQRLDWRKEFSRQKVKCDLWKESDLNINYAYCDTYPELLMFPREATLPILIGSCNFRSKSRLPALTYFYFLNTATICRCAQPLTGFSARCIEDEALMELIMNSNQTFSPLYLIDTRPRVNAMVNKVQGKGFEDTRNYTNMQFHFFDIENIHVMRSSLSKLLESNVWLLRYLHKIYAKFLYFLAIQKPQTMTQYLKGVDGSGWLKHLRSLLECGRFIAESIMRGISCVVHCSDGWDRTAQTVSIAQLIIDGYFRTIHGFQVLIDKDWLGFGHKFDDRCGHVASNSDETSKEISPIFVQFLDTVYQLMRKNPTAFEFNERFLIYINEHVYSMIYGTFLGNCDKDRKDLHLAHRTQSLWVHMDSLLDDFANPFYEECDLSPQDVDVKPSSFVVWTAMYNRFDNGVHPREYSLDLALNTKLHIEFLRGLLEDEALKIHPNISIKWQPLLNSDECSNASCNREFDSRFCRRLHCLSCGRIFCNRCFAINNTLDRVCKCCAA